MKRDGAPFSALSVIGGGAWGAALGHLAASNGVPTTIWAREAEVAQAINGGHENSSFLPGVKLHPALKATSDIAGAAGAEAFLFAVPAQHGRAVMRTVAPLAAPGSPVAICSKGIEQTTGFLLTEILKDVWPASLPAVLSGPSFAAGDPPVVVIANKAMVTPPLGREELRTIFQTKRAIWSDGVPIRPFNLPDATAGRRLFDLAVLSLDPTRVARYWIDRQVRSGDRPPPTVPSSALMIRIIAKTVGSIGYIEGAAVHPGVKVVARIADGQVVKP